jgi:RNA polymerase sigma factor (sigma-70 family)
MLFPDDDIIWQQVLEGGYPAWRQLVRRYSGLVLSVARRVGLSESDAEDCTQQVWLALFRNRQKIRDPAGLPAWLSRASRRQAIKIRQRQARRTEMERTDRWQNAAVLPDSELEHIERQEMLRHALNQLDDRCQKLLTALFLSEDDKSYSEAAAALGLAPNSLGPLRSRCLKKLQKNLQKIGYHVD